jgi:hypothetical protein
MPDELRDNLIALLVKRGHKGKEIVDEVRGILSLIDAQRCVWTLNGEDWITQCGADIPDEDTYEKYPYCPRCGKRISIKEDKNV